MQTTYVQQAKSITERFTTLSDHAEKLAFPNYRKGIFASKDLSGSKTIPKYIYSLSHPFSTPETPNSWFMFIWLLFVFLEEAALFYAALFLYPQVFRITPLFPSSSLSTVIPAVLYLVLVGLPVSVIAYAWWWDTLSAQKNLWWVKVLLITVAFSVLTSFTLSLTPNGPTLQMWDWNIFERQPGAALVAVFAFLFPAISFFAAIAFDFVLSVLLIVKTLFGGVASVHASRPTETILRLATEEISSGKPNQTGWKLADLTRDEVVLLRQWAEANREGSEKRTLPATIIAAFIGVVLTSDYLRNIFDNILSFLGSGVLSLFNMKTSFLFPNNVSISMLVLFLLTIIFLLTVAKKLIALFKNIVAQNLIVEACLVAEYSLPKLETEKPSKASFFDKLVSLFFKN